MKTALKGIIGVAVCAVAAVTAYAAVTFDPTTGKGFVGKGDVQTAFVWNNAKLQSNAEGLKFRFDNKTKYTATCEWVTGEGTRGEKTHEVEHTRQWGIDKKVVFNPRIHKQIDGFNLNGYQGNGLPTHIGTIPVVGEACHGNGSDGTWTSVTMVGESVGLVVSHNGEEKPLLYTVPEPLVPLVP